MEYCVVTFHSVHEALHFEKVLKEVGLNLQLIPVPREISSSCGIAARFALGERPQFEEIILSQDLEIDRIHVLAEKHHKRKNLLNLFN